MVTKLSLILIYLHADGDAEADEEDGYGELVKDSDGAEDVPEDLLKEELLHEDRQHPKHVQDVQEGDRGDQRSHERLEVVALPEKE